MPIENESNPKLNFFGMQAPGASAEDIAYTVNYYLSKAHEKSSSNPETANWLKGVQEKITAKFEYYVKNQQTLSDEQLKQKIILQMGTWGLFFDDEWYKDPMQALNLIPFVIAGMGYT